MPAGFLSRVEWADEWGLSAQHTSQLLRKGINSGLIICRMIRRRLVDGRTRPIPYYAEKKAG